ncbi:TIGR02530 family flagellar biosynthesis protein [Clostridium sp. DL1XJH146]
MSFKVNNDFYNNLNKQNNSKRVGTNKTSFEDMLQKQINRDSLKNKDFNVNKANGSDIKISKHAQRRLDSRNIELTSKDMTSLSNAMDKAKDKGAEESLLIYKNLAFVSNISSKTIITTMEIDGGEGNIFTNIDSAVFVK